MPLLLNEEQAMLRDSARDFLAARAPVAALRRLRDERSADGYSPELWRQFAEMGYTGVLVPEDLGGLGLGHVEAGIVMEQIGHHLTASPLLASGIVAVSALRAGGTPEQQAQWCPRLAAGAAIATLAVDEGVKHRPLQIGLRARVEGAELVLDGDKTFVPDGHVADLLVVAARSAGQPGEADGITLVLVPRDAAGVEVERTVMADAHNAARFGFRAVRVGTDAVLGRLGEGAAALQAALDAGRAAAAGELLGLADEVFARTVRYLKERTQFGRLIGEFQALQHRAAMLYCELELTRAAVLKAQQALDGNTPKASAAVAVAKARAGRTATQAVQEGVQMHGGIGMTDAFDIGLFMKRARVLQELYGDSAFHQDQLATSRQY
ncbi:acyl-CoA/acyl-ACP dehydrogenase [Aquabacterium sp. A7-Y]|uniref:acyl-CoA dehydrogenase family protein n=1 Tax=Aquabacterium sp. A7-Y TaxID=1349605 RepID=UPI00223D537F|nr:acyl-CoA dehydrogenase family protein [Aquabacterium sp. A7-Y]MCW7536953.1 acyl-CoA/acyl-ACP dehydrogenase [Aquabacterium sp. A7-Y]